MNTVHEAGIETNLLPYLNPARFVNKQSAPLGERGILKPESLARRENFLIKFYSALITERNGKAQETISDEVLGAENMVKGLFEYITLRVFCTDGRLSGPVVFGFPPGFGGMFKISAADIPDLRYDAHGEPYLIPNSYFLQLLDKYFENNETPMCEVFDSHVGCAARGLTEKSLGKHPLDGGLYSDVYRKKAIVTASKNYITKKYPQREYFPVQFSFDPHNGYGYMGLETEKALAAGKKTTYIADTINNLADEGIIISTHQIGVQLSKQFEAESFAIDWARNYKQSMGQFWKAIEKLSKDKSVTEPIINMVKKMYPDEDEKQRQHRVLLLLANSFNGFLQNKGQTYPYGEHKEACGVVEERSNGPFAKIGAFLLHPLSEKLPRDIQLIRDIVTENRKSERIQDFTGTYTKPGEFIRAPIPFVVKSIVRQGLKDEDWKVVQGIGDRWNKLPSKWFDMDEGEFAEWLTQTTNGELVLPIHMAAMEIFNYMKKLYRTNEIYTFIDSGSLVFLPVIVDSKREVKAIVELPVT